MLQNIKVDVIYYKTSTDFEMEFNLCGCCRMRLLTDKVSDKKTFVHSLARAVSRSRVMIVAGSLFGEEGTLNLVAGALNSKLSKINNKDYGISDEEDIFILNGSTPLVTPDGIFGGCIIESGPQTMILISDSKNIRKSIMNSLIHPYFEELSVSANNVTVTPAIENEEIEEIEDTQEETLAEEEISEEVTENEVEDTEETTEETADEEEIVEEQIEEENLEAEEDTVEELETIDSEAEEETDKATEVIIGDDEFVTTDGIIFEEDVKGYRGSYESDNDFIVDDGDIAPKPRFYNNENDNGADEYVADIPYHSPFIRKSSPLSIAILILSIILLVTIAVLCYFIFYVPSKNGVSADAYIREIFNVLFS